jgi:hypothetical protein
MGNRRGEEMKRNSLIVFALVVCMSVLLTGLAYAAPIQPVPEPVGILAFLGAVVAGIAAIKSRSKK